MAHFESGHISLLLERYPEEASSELQAWEAADEYLLQELEGIQPQGPVLIFNDQFGALACALHSFSPLSIGDSFISQQALQQNMIRNALPIDGIRWQDTLQPIPENPAVVIIKIPKTLALLEHQLLMLKAVMGPDTQILAGAKARDIHTSTLQLFERIIGPTRTSLAWKKARLVYATPNMEQPALPSPYPTVWTLDGDGEQIYNHANVFSRGSLDIGARFFMQHIPSGISGTLVDLGCGNGVIGLTALKQNPDAEVIFIDESYMAVQSSRMNIEQNYPDLMPRCHFVVGNSLETIPANSVNLILCNPPFHQQQSITDHIAWQMFRDARRCLKKGGFLRIIGNRHLAYHLKLRRIFNQCVTVAGNKKFVILQSEK